jgi:hypothetical protein
MTQNTLFSMSVTKFLNVFVLCLLAFIALECKNNPDAQHAAVNPFDTMPFNTQALSDKDKAELMNANGKTARAVNTDTIVSQVKNASDHLHIWCFWSLNNAASMATAKALNAAAEPFDSTQLTVHYVNMPGLEKMTDVQLFIRENQLTGETLILEKGDVSFFSRKIKPDFRVTTLPILLLANKNNNTLLCLEKPFDQNELRALITPLF